MVVQLIDDHRDRFGVEPACRVLTEHEVKIAPSVYCAVKMRPVAAQTLRDEELVVEIKRVFWGRKLGRGIRGIRGMRKMWHLQNRQGIVVARCTVERLMRRQGLQGIRRGKQFITARPDQSAARPPGHVKRNVTACRPNQLGVVDFTAFVTDVFLRRIMGWRTDGPHTDHVAAGHTRDGAIGP